MNKFLCIILCQAFLSPFLVSHVLSAELIFFNASDVPINALRLTDNDTKRGYSLLDTALAPKEAVKIQMPEKKDIWDIMAVDPNGSAVNFNKVDLKDVKQVHLFHNGTLEIYR